MVILIFQPILELIDNKSNGSEANLKAELQQNPDQSVVNHSYYRYMSKKQVHCRSTILFYIVTVMPWIACDAVYSGSDLFKIFVTVIS